ncbi:MAG TPA: hypothetical protein VK465_09395 [Fibrobacteria bacterium]|nr:hypothetical protein [Fibrobacteria bacterium]
MKDLENAENRSFKDGRAFEEVAPVSERAGEVGADEVGGRDVVVISNDLKGVVSRSEPAGERRVGRVERAERPLPEIVFLFIMESSFAKDGDYQFLLPIPFHKVPPGSRQG